MKSDPPADPILLLRQQLILAQVRLMELEDIRDELTPQLAEAEHARVSNTPVSKAPASKAPASKAPKDGGLA